MADRLIMHVGTPKSGTTYLQSILWSNQERLREAGVLLPGELPFDHSRLAQRVRLDHPDKAARETWRRLNRQIQAWPGTVLLSSEWFCMADEDQVRWAVEKLGVADVHVVATARDLTRTVPGGWQESLKLGRGLELSEFIDRLEDGHRWRWSTMDPSVFLPRWQAVVPQGHVHLVTVPVGQGSQVLWDRFSGLIGDLPEMHTESTFSNESISAQSARLVQRMGPRLGQAVAPEGTHWTQRYRWIRGFLCHDVLGPLGSSRIGIPAADFERLHARARVSVATLAAAGYDVVGDLSELLATGPVPDAVWPGDVTEAELLDVAEAAITTMVLRVRTLTGRATRFEARVAELEAELAEARRLRARAVEHPVLTQAGRARRAVRRRLPGGR